MIITIVDTICRHSRRAKHKEVAPVKYKLIFLLSLTLMAMFLIAGVIHASETGGEAEGHIPSGDEVDLKDPVALEDLVNRLADGEKLTDNEMEGVVHFLTVDESQTTFTTTISTSGSTDDAMALDGISGCGTNEAAVGCKNVFGIAL